MPLAYQACHESPWTIPPAVNYYPLCEIHMSNFYCVNILAEHSNLRPRRDASFADCYLPNMAYWRLMMTELRARIRAGMA